MFFEKTRHMFRCRFSESDFFINWETEFSSANKKRVRLEELSEVPAQQL